MTLALKQTSQLFLELLADLWRFPWWWYTGGAKLVALWCWEGFSDTRARLAIGLFARYLFHPMYQDYSWQGRAISLFMRLFLLIVKLVRLVFSAAWHLLVLWLWLALLPVGIIIIFS
jgi:hypothetical protein